MFWFSKKSAFNPECYQLGWASVIQAIRDYSNVKMENIIWRDQYYQVPVNPEYVMRSIPVKVTFKKDSRDCDDFVRIFRGELSKLGCGNLLAMDVSIETETGPHALIGFLQHHKLVFGEPQTGKIINPEIKKINWIIL